MQLRLWGVLALGMAQRRPGGCGSADCGDILTAEPLRNPRFDELLQLQDFSKGASKQQSLKSKKRQIPIRPVIAQHRRIQADQTTNNDVPDNESCKNPRSSTRRHDFLHILNPLPRANNWICGLCGRGLSCGRSGRLGPFSLFRAYTSRSLCKFSGGDLS